MLPQQQPVFQRIHSSFLVVHSAGHVPMLLAKPGYIVLAPTFAQLLPLSHVAGDLLLLIFPVSQ